MKKGSANLSVVELLLKDIELHIPKRGYELVVVDDFEFFGEQLYIIDHSNTLEEALATKHKIGNKAICMIYDSKGNVY